MDDPPASPVMFDGDGPPRSRRYGDVYFSREGGLAESRAVFLTGCGLPERWAGKQRFTVGELGFGTGLNILALLELWRAHRPPGGQLSIFSVEADPLSADEARRALGAWPELADLSAPLLAHWPGHHAGFHRLALPEFAATLDLAVMDAALALAAWNGRADAWFLDGFAPAVNPAMWSDELMALVAARSAPGAIAATYTVAGQVRRALAAAGFRIERRPGFGGKRERLEAILPGEPQPASAPKRVAVIGAGIAGAALARAFRDQGVAALVFDAAHPGAGASGNPAALVTPRLDAGLGEAAQLHAAAFADAIARYQALDGAVIARGVLQLEAAPRDAGRFAKIVGSGLFEAGDLAPCSAAETGQALGESAPPALRLATALVVDPARILSAWLPATQNAKVAALESAEGGWRLLDGDGQALGAFDVVCVATGAAMADLWPEAPIQPVRGQLSWVRAAPSTPAAAWGAYVAPTRDGIMFGATHDRDDAGDDWRAADDARNLAALANRLPALAGRLTGGAISGRAAIRATTPDRMPIAGWAQPGLAVLGGLGSRGFTLAPLLAQHVAALALGAPSPLPAPLARLISPGRFAERAARRGLVPRAASV